MKCRHVTSTDYLQSFGSNLLCAFKENGKFNSNNWNCMLMDKLRDLAYKTDNITWAEDQNVAVIPYYCSHVVLSYYKNRGKTDGFWIVSDSEIREGTEEDVKKILKYAKDNKPPQ